MRLSKDQIRARIKGEISIGFSEERLTAYGGLELLRRYLVGIDLAGRLRRALGGRGPPGDYGVVGMVLALIGLLVVGGMRVAHLAFVGTDPMLLRFCGLQRVPSDRTVGRWLRRFSNEALEALADVIRDLVYVQIERLGLRRLTLDLDGTVLRARPAMEGAAHGYNPHHPKDPSYYPLTAHVAALGQILRVWNRPGNVNDAHNAEGFLRVVVRELRERFGRGLRLELRMDGAFFQKRILGFLVEEGLEYAIKAPFHSWLGLKGQIQARRRWRGIGAGIEGFEAEVPRALRSLVPRVVVYRKRVSGRTHKNYQLDLFSPEDGHWEYSAIATNKPLGRGALWHFMAGRGAHEKTLAELKQHYGFAAIPSYDRRANEAWQRISVLALNLVRSFQIALGGVRRPRSWKRTFAYVLPSLQTLRFRLIQHPARLVRPAGRAELRFAVAPRARREIEHAQRRLKQAA